MPFGPDCEYKDFDACVKANGDKEDPEGYCGEIQRATEKKCADRDQNIRSQIEFFEGCC